MTAGADRVATLQSLDEPTAALVRLSVVLTTGDELAIRAGVATVAGRMPDLWVEELILQTHLFAGFPRALNAMREWRRLVPMPADAGLEPPPTAERKSTSEQGEDTCARVYGATYERLRHNIRALHPLLDDWMIVDGYGKVLSRPGLDLARRELCIVAACAAAEQDRQLHSHLHGALNAGASTDVVTAAIDTIAAMLDADRARAVRLLWQRVRRH